MTNRDTAGPTAGGDEKTDEDGTPVENPSG